ncbi:hypothetical protein MINS_31690 [Mycolicibacterium insubricum]|jgi:hypothetical protein|uniref:Uncharacterized protein n=1 Tax=Mycolicibacterium insubricum TaxID=444597 RepID=A0A1X0D5E6_9MYCO|nr:hypothetical protein [Mycolicibacterium insubricum]MCB9441283.1 hypothetical protein [Mycolicibacterium sp.]MCV7083837.1 hypothetical protein [Mycolicibacterium insubricum]ORA67402.1 hypothetical protein BST26_15825 [Mycolicibacterium insubricum]BBZ67740.1 hypothetical protein MINS_31690 [Mycolicibacterium insubricum]
MPYLITGKRIGVDRLVDGLLTARAGTTQREWAKTALIDANPALGRAAVPRGTLLRIPKMTNLRQDLSALGEVLESARRADVAATIAGLPARAAKDCAAARNLQKQRSEHLDRLAAGAANRGPGLGKRSLSRLRNGLDQTVADADARAERLSAAVPNWLDRLAALDELQAQRRY